jgi:hypothetical protein
MRGSPHPLVPASPNSSASPQKESGTAAAAALNKVKGLGAAVVPSLHSGRQEPPHAPAARTQECGMDPRSLSHGLA